MALALLGCDADRADPDAATPPGDASPRRDGSRPSEMDAQAERDAEASIVDANLPDAALPDANLPPPGCGPSALSEAAAGLAAGTFMEFSTTGFDRDLVTDGGAGNVYQFSFESFWHADSCQVLFVGGGHLSETHFVVYGAERNEWFRAPDPDYLCPIRTGDGEVAWGCVHHAYGFDAMDPHTGTFYYRYADGDVYSIDVAGGNYGPAWDRVGSEPASAGRYSSMAYHADLGRLVVVHPDELLLLDPTDGSWETLPGPFEMGGYHWYGVYNPLDRGMLFGSGNGSSAMHRLAADRRVARIADAPRGFHPQPDRDTPGFKILTYDPVSGVYLAVAMNGDLFEYRTSTDTWSRTPVTLPPNLWSAAPIDSYGVLMFIDVPARRIYLYRHS